MSTNEKNKATDSSGKPKVVKGILKKSKEQYERETKDSV
jgi:hypothetical protein